MGKRVYLLIAILQIVPNVIGDNTNHACCSEPCQNGGTCDVISGGSGFQCRCRQDYEGRMCEKKNLCRMVNIGARERLGEADITLAVSYSSCNTYCMGDKRCDTAVGRTSSPYQCKLYHSPGANKESSDKSVVMYARTCYTFTWMNEEGCEAKRYPCLNNGYCKTRTPIGYECICPKGFSGKNCEYAINLDKCNVQTLGSIYRSSSGSYRAFYNKDPLVCKNGCITDPTCMEAMWYNSSSTTTVNGLCRLYNSTSEFYGSLATTNTRYIIYRSTCDRIPDGDDCKADPCQNCGVCYNHHKRAECKCHGGFSGASCENVVPVDVTGVINPDIQTTPSSPGEEGDDGPSFGALALALGIVVAFIGGAVLAVVGCGLYQRRNPPLDANSISNQTTAPAQNVDEHLYEGLTPSVLGQGINNPSYNNRK